MAEIDPKPAPFIPLALLTVAALRHGIGPDCELIETHISTLLLAGEFAYKLRKPLALGFLDFSTAQQRRHDGEEELRLNRRTAPQLYLDVLPVLGPAQAPRVGHADEGGAAIEWLLRMRRFDNDQLLDRLATRGQLGEADVDALARRVAAFHAALPASPAAYGDPQGVLAWARANFTAAGVDAPDRLRDWTEQEFVRIAPPELGHCSAASQTVTNPAGKSWGLAARPALAGAHVCVKITRIRATDESRKALNFKRFLEAFASAQKNWPGVVSSGPNPPKRVEETEVERISISP